MTGAPERRPVRRSAVARSRDRVLAAFNAAERARAGRRARRPTSGRARRARGPGGEPGGGEPEEVLLAVALAVRAIRGGSVCVDLPRDRRDGARARASGVDVSALPWPEPAAWRRACAASPLVADGEGAADAGRPLRLVGEPALPGAVLAARRSWSGTQFERAAPARWRPSTRSGCARRWTGCSARTRCRAPAAGRRRRGAAAGQRARRRAGHRQDHDRGPAARAAARPARRRPLGSGPAPAADRAGRPDREGRGAAARETVAARAADLPPGDRELVAGTTASTLHRLLGPAARSSRFRHHRGNRLPHDVVVVDETSMVSLTMMARLLDAVRPDARLVLVGDPDQLASVEAGAVLGDLAARPPGRPEPDAGVRRSGRPAPWVPGEAADDAGAGRCNGVVTLDHDWRFGGAIAAFARGRAGRRRRRGRRAAALRRRPSCRSSRPTRRRSRRTGSPALRADVVAAGQRPHRGGGGRGRRAAALRGAGRAPGAVRAPPRAVRRRALDRRGRALARRRTTGLRRRGRPGTRAVRCWSPRTTTTWGCSTATPASSCGPETAARAAFSRAAARPRSRPPGCGEVATVHAMTVHRGQGSQFRRVTVVLPPRRVAAADPGAALHRRHPRPEARPGGRHRGRGAGRGRPAGRPGERAAPAAR